MSRGTLALMTLVAGLALPPMARADDVSVAVGLPGFGLFIGPPPVVVEPPIVAYPPPPVFYEAPPVVYAPPIYRYPRHVHRSYHYHYGRPAYVRHGHDYWRHDKHWKHHGHGRGRGHRKHHDDDD